MADNKGGYEYDFVEEVADRYICNICTKPLCEPHLVVCCGQHYCHSCLKEWFKNQSSCPYCRACSPNFQYVNDKKLKREILALKVKCTNHQEGCEWTGELGTLNDHLESSYGCGYVEVECPNKCTKKLSWVPETYARVKIKRKHVSFHCTKQCRNREYKCEHCGKRDTYTKITGLGSNYLYAQNHYQQCPEKPVACPNNCGVDKIKRRDIENHRGECPLENIYCPNKCKTKDGTFTKMLRKVVDSHLKDECYLRRYKCICCSLESTYEAITGYGVYKKQSHYQVCPEFPLPCPNECGIGHIKRKDMNTHCQIYCPDETVSCPNNCDHLARGMKRKDLEQHLIAECKMRQHLCEYCNMQDTYTAITEHYATCSRYPLECPNKCGARGILRKNIKSHCNKCPQQPVECPFVGGGCKTKVVRQELDKHISTMQQGHQLLMMEAFTQMKQEYQKELQKTRNELKKHDVELTRTKQELKQTRTELRQTKKELEDTKKSLSQYVKKRGRRRPPRYPQQSGFGYVDQQDEHDYDSRYYYQSEFKHHYDDDDDDDYYD